MSRIQETLVHEPRRALAGLAGSIADLLSEMSAGVDGHRPLPRLTSGWPARRRWRRSWSTHALWSTRRWAFLSRGPLRSQDGLHRVVPRACRAHTFGGPAACDSPHAVRPPDRRTPRAARQSRRGALPAPLSPTAPRPKPCRETPRAWTLPWMPSAKPVANRFGNLRRVDETGAWVVSGAILTEVDRMVRDSSEVALPRWGS